MNLDPFAIEFRTGAHVRTKAGQWYVETERGTFPVIHAERVAKLEAERAAARKAEAEAEDEADER